MSAGPAFQTQEQATDREEAAPVNDKEPAETSVANDTSHREHLGRELKAR